jgi:hypothetical protein
VAQVFTFGGPLGTGETIVNIEPGFDGSALVKWIFV